MTRGMLLEVAFALVLAAIGIYQRRWMGDVLLVLAFTNLQNAYGLYKVSVLSKAPEAEFAVEAEPR